MAKAAEHSHKEDRQSIFAQFFIASDKCHDKLQCGERRIYLGDLLIRRRADNELPPPPTGCHLRTRRKDGQTGQVDARWIEVPN